MEELGKDRVMVYSGAISSRHGRQEPNLNLLPRCLILFMTTPRRSPAVGLRHSFCRAVLGSSFQQVRVAVNDDHYAPRPTRVSLMLTATAERAGGGLTKHRLLNISERGAALSDPQGLMIGTEVALWVGVLEAVPAVVVRAEADRVGVRFHNSVDVAAARKRPLSKSSVAVEAGWLGNMRDRYRR